MAINDALKKLINTLGGTYTADDDTISELLEQVDAAFAGGGGGAIYWINATPISESELSLDKTYAEITEALEAGKYPIVIMNIQAEESASMNVYFRYVYNDLSNSNSLLFETIQSSADYNDDISVYKIVLSTQDIATIYPFEIALKEDMPFYVWYTVTESEGSLSATCDKEYSDIVSAIQGGKQIVCNIRGVMFAQTDNYVYASDDHNIVFTLAVVDGQGGVSCYAIVHASNDNIVPITPA